MNGKNGKNIIFEGGDGTGSLGYYGNSNRKFFPCCQFKAPYIVIEGGEGGGKGTQIKLLTALLQKLGIKCKDTREPGGTEFGEKEIRPMLVKNIVKEKYGNDLNSLEELMAFTLDRSYTIRTQVYPWVTNGFFTLSDRNFFSTIRYQVAAGGQDYDFVKSLIIKAVGYCMPDLVIGLDLDPKIGIQRSLGAETTGDETRFEEKNLEFHHKVRNGMFALEKESKQIGSWLPATTIVNAEDTIKNVHMTIRKELVDRELLPPEAMLIPFEDLKIEAA